jgi:hypothetical protein
MTLASRSIWANETNPNCVSNNAWVSYDNNRLAASLAPGGQHAEALDARGTVEQVDPNDPASDWCLVEQGDSIDGLAQDSSLLPGRSGNANGAGAQNAQNGLPSSWRQSVFSTSGD